MNLTDGGQKALHAYLAEVGRSLAGRRDIDVEDLLAGIREHVEAELAWGAPDPATVEDVASVLERLGAPDVVAAQDVDNRDAESRDVDRHAFILLVVAVAAGVSLLLVPSPLFPVGWLLLAGGLAAARLALPAGEVIRSAEGRTVLLIWRLGVLCAAVVLLVGPAALVWAAAQIGGVLEGPLASWVGAPGNQRPAAYWVAMTAVAGGVTGLWWFFWGWLTRRQWQRLRRSVGATWLPLSARSGRGLSLAGGLLLAMSLVGVLIT